MLRATSLECYLTVTPYREPRVNGVIGKIIKWVGIPMYLRTTEPNDSYGGCWSETEDDFNEQAALINILDIRNYIRRVSRISSIALGSKSADAILAKHPVVETLNAVLGQYRALSTHA